MFLLKGKFWELLAKNLAPQHDMALILNLRKSDEWRQNRVSFGHRQVGIIGKVAVKRQRYTELHKWIISGNGYYGLRNLKVCQIIINMYRRGRKKKKKNISTSICKHVGPTNIQCFECLLRSLKNYSWTLRLRVQAVLKNKAAPTIFWLSSLLELHIILPHILHFHVCLHINQ